MKNNSEVWVEQKKMRTGYTTGSCAAAAAKAAVCMLLSGEVIQQVRLMTPKGVELDLEVEQIERRQHGVRCAVRKDSGDDPDVTNGIYVYAEVRKEPEPGIYLDGGEGIGRITKKGLEQPVGAAAINRVPRQMILEAVKEQSIRYGYQGGLSVIISAPEGKKLAAKTFNPRLGIENGISILGTSGIVEPMSEKALTDTIFLEMKMLKENGIDRCCVVPGNYGRDFLAEQLGVDTDQAVKCQQLYRGDDRRRGESGNAVAAFDRTYRQVDQSGGRCDEYSFETGGLPDGSAGSLCGGRGSFGGVCTGDPELYYDNGSAGTFERKRNPVRSDGAGDGAD